MPVERWSSAQVEALAPDPGSVRNARGVLDRFTAAGRLGDILWGLCRGYQVAVDLTGPAFTCSCPSRKTPCKHALALLLRWGGADEPAPEFAVRWQAARARPRRSGTPDPVAAAKRLRERAERVAGGMAELRRWLDDQVSHGLAGLSSGGHDSGGHDSGGHNSGGQSFGGHNSGGHGLGGYGSGGQGFGGYGSAGQNLGGHGSGGRGEFESMAARLVDAQAPGAASTVRRLAGLAGAGPHWADRVLGELSLLRLLVDGHERLGTLDPALAAGVRSRIGFPTATEEVLAGPRHTDRWQVLGQVEVDDGPLTTRRTWLHGCDSDRFALVLAFAAPGQPLSTDLVPGTEFRGDLCFYPGAAPLRALVAERVSAAEPFPSPAGAESVRAALSRWSRLLAQDPFRYDGPMLLRAVRFGDGHLIDAHGDALPLAPGFREPWWLLAAAGGHPADVAAEWSPAGLRPLAAWVGEAAFTPVTGGGGAADAPTATPAPPFADRPAEATGGAFPDAFVVAAGPVPDPGARREPELPAELLAAALVGTARRPWSGGTVAAGSVRVSLGPSGSTASPQMPDVSRSEADRSTADKPHSPAAEEPTTDTPPADEPTTDTPPADQPTTNTPPADQPTTDTRPADSAAAALLGAAAVALICRRAGVEPAAGRSPVPEAPPETAPPLPAAASARLGLILIGGAPGGGHLEQELLAQWLAAAAERGGLVRPALLPALLDAGRRNTMLRPALARVAGARGAWLAGQRADWRWLLSEAGRLPRSATDYRDQWQTGAGDVRLGLLAALRRSDPGRARELLESTWDQESPEDRARFLTTFATGLSRHDEPLLERSLDDRRKEVREAALDLLRVLPGADLGRRMARRAHAAVRFDGRRLVVTPPEELDDGLRRDGVGAAAVRGVGAGAWLLEEVVAGTPLSTWTSPPCDEHDPRHQGDRPAVRDDGHRGDRPDVHDEHRGGGPDVHDEHRGGGPDVRDGHRGGGPDRSQRPHPSGHPDDGPDRRAGIGLDPAEWVRVARGHDWATPLLHGWAKAAIVQRDPEWAAALLTAASGALRESVRWDLHLVLPPGHLARLAASALRSEDGSAHRLLSLLPGPWPGHLAVAVLETVAARARTDRHTWQLGELCRTAALALPPGYADLAGRLAAELDQSLESSRVRPVTDLARTLSFRHEMLQELQ